MITKVRERGIYDELHTTELMSVLETGSNRFDLVLSTDVFIYIGDLGEIFLATSRNLRPGGWFCFSVETADYGQDFVLRTSGDTRMPTRTSKTGCAKRLRNTGKQGGHHPPGARQCHTGQDVCNAHRGRQLI
jgi:predicted TPR repeat methyltransferase